ncbi:MAG TPA: hypothetical protein VNB49_12835 [Candidatus Dormibacteraeota bacterium]|nr:hypothetical protein [Candidatus Dormibacteraeota bacterium]
MGILSKWLGIDKERANLAELERMVKARHDELTGLEGRTETRILYAQALERKLKPQLDLEAEALRLRAENEILRATAKITREIAVAARAVLDEENALEDSQAMLALRKAVGANGFITKEAKQ